MRALSRRALFAATTAMFLCVSSLATSAQVLNPCRSGETSGRWNIPTAAGGGFVHGKLTALGGNAVFRMKGELTRTPSPMGQVRGTLRGDLDNGGPAYPRYSFFGEYRGNAFGNGEWNATIYKQVSPLGPIIQAGRMKGRYSDPPISTMPVGTYKGRWQICF